MTASSPGSPVRSENKYAVAFLGFGEAASAFRRGFGDRAPASFRAYDIKTDTEGPDRNGKLAAYEAARVEGCLSRDEALAGADVVFSMVTADQALDAARAAAKHLRADALYLDCNSCAPQTKQKAAGLIEAAGARYVDIAVMAPVHPLLHRTPLLISGPHTAAALALAADLALDAKDAQGDVGRASSIKLVRSIMMKGLEALALECVLAGRQLGVDDVVLASLEQTYPGFGWDGRTGQMLERAMVHGTRRAAEMEEATKMVAELGLPSGMASATAAWQRQVGALDLKRHPSVSPDAPRTARADAILAALSERGIKS
jgi:3-hydroxyisobutyrate dehydrogenase-like beta-hydroxyacid dehydrogenase